MQLKRRTVVLGILAVALIGCGVYGASIVHHGFSTRTAPSKLERGIATSARFLAIPAGAKGLRNPVQSSPEVIGEAKAHWADHCAQCHANDGSGDAEIGRNLYPRPPDMRLRDTQRLSDGELYFTINRGVRLSGMPAFGTPGDDDLASWKLVDFIRYLPRMSAEEATRMKKLNPKTVDELNEEREEDQFLNGSSQPEKHRTGRKQ
jgi:mono/diheme cytochrome c family protein